MNGTVGHGMFAWVVERYGAGSGQWRWCEKV